MGACLPLTTTSPLTPTPLSRVPSQVLKGFGASAPKEDQRLVLQPEALRRLEAYSWPGNIDELQSTLTSVSLGLRDTNLVTDEPLWSVAQDKDRFRCASCMQGRFVTCSRGGDLVLQRWELCF